MVRLASQEEPLPKMNPFSAKKQDMGYGKLCILTFLYLPFLFVLTPFLWLLCLFVVISYPFYCAVKKIVDFIEK